MAEEAYTPLITEDVYTPFDNSRSFVRKKECIMFLRAFSDRWPNQLSKPVLSAPVLTVTLCAHFGW